MKILTLLIILPCHAFAFNCRDLLRYLYANHESESKADLIGIDASIQSLHKRLNRLSFHYEAMEAVLPQDLAQELTQLTVAYQKGLEKLGVKAKIYAVNEARKFVEYTPDMVVVGDKKFQIFMVLFPFDLPAGKGGELARTQRVVKTTWARGFFPVINLKLHASGSLGSLSPDSGRISFHVNLLNDLLKDGQRAAGAKSGFLRNTNTHEQIHLFFKLREASDKPSLFSMTLRNSFGLNVPKTGHPLGSDYIDYASYEKYFSLEELYTHLYDAMIFLETAQTGATRKIGLAMNMMERTLKALDTFPTPEKLPTAPLEIGRMTRAVNAPELFPAPKGEVSTYYLRYTDPRGNTLQLPVANRGKNAGDWEIGDESRYLALPLSRSGLPKEIREQLVGEYRTAIKALQETLPKALGELRPIFLQLKNATRAFTPGEVDELSSKILKVAKQLFHHYN